jgi:23S rRNA (adenine2030-N6)-methyltransferase
MSYPGSPFISQYLLNKEDKLRLFELHPTDFRLLEKHVAQLRANRQVAVLREDGFEHLKKFLPPPSRRGLVLIDPSYEIKTDYQRLVQTVADALLRFATGTYMIWYPIIARPESHALPRRLKTLAQQSKRPWLNVSLTVKSAKQESAAVSIANDQKPSRPGLVASGVFLINPPFTLKDALKDAMPQMVSLLGQDRHAGFQLETG